jgi:hypothetical protein
MFDEKTRGQNSHETLSLSEPQFRTSCAAGLALIFLFARLTKKKRVSLHKFSE